MYWLLNDKVNKDLRNCTNRGDFAFEKFSPRGKFRPVESGLKSSLKMSKKKEVLRNDRGKPIVCDGFHHESNWTRKTCCETTNIVKRV